MAWLGYKFNKKVVGIINDVYTNRKSKPVDGGHDNSVEFLGNDTIIYSGWVIFDNGIMVEVEIETMSGVERDSSECELLGGTVYLFVGDDYIDLGNCQDSSPTIDYVNFLLDANKNAIVKMIFLNERG